MKLLAAAVFAFLAVSAFCNEVRVDGWELDWSEVVPVQDLPGFWEGRDIKPLNYFGDKPHRSGRIVGGAIVTPHSLPFQVALLMNFVGGTGLCGATRVTPRTVLTAAHCLVGSSSTLLIFGAHNIETVEANQFRTTILSSGYRIHGGFVPSTLMNDIALMITNSVIPTNSFIQSIALAPENAPNYAGVTGTVIGWGRTTDSSAATSPQLRSVTVPIITNALCEATFGGVVTASNICISTTGRRGTCNGDNGGPLTTGTTNNRIQVGISSFRASSGCEHEFPTVFTRVSTFRVWIQSNWVV